MDKQVINVAFVGGGKGCYDILTQLKSYPPIHLHPNIVAVADIDSDAVGFRHARRLGIPTTSDYRQFLRDRNIDLIIELTGNDKVLTDILKNKLESIKVLDHVGALFLWEIIAIQEEKLKLEKKVSDLDTMAAIGEISYRLTHEIRNPLMIIGGLVRRMMTRIDLPHGIRKRLKHIASHVQHIEEVISDICDVVRPLNPHYKLTDMTAFMHSWCNAVKSEARLVGVGVDVHIEEDLPSMYIDPSLMRQALWHILENSLDAMADKGGTITIKTVVCWDNIHIEMSDSGSGFGSMSTTKAMEPFTSTRLGKMGLGLALCRQIVQGHDGILEIIDQKGTGATVIIELPVRFKMPKKNQPSRRQKNRHEDNLSVPVALQSN
ncbi:MAG: ATP-binding protein [Desulfobulbaceae bacterium]|nr:ATP-binding protein [Desulfobulbaceae bacterium]